MTERLALFPLGTVLFPGATLPLHLFEERYRLLARDLLARPEPRRFGVVGIELGHEVGPGSAQRLAEVGCVAEVRRISPHPDGRFDLVAVGGARFRVKRFDRSLPYLRGDVELLPERPGPAAEPLAEAVRALFARYLKRLAAAGARLAEPPPLPADPVALSYTIAAAAVLDPPDKQRLLAAEDAGRRLRAELALLHREARLLSVLPTVPAGQFLDGGVTPN
ncbi:LON peptidase substrate-binding domain-containing protein [Actinomadura parmotrematis]|uniref:LON peptidase substrate-binding domain-containing protein n=1 Tax=Actinomadura parmotrematis TaxID=2864039 RepID=A0ABS7FKZ1_9ACTN|nr:LON peptidase substrate-binding domain-containing protein [Actinomadura parmotrematis]MBW8481042.1 LON peptidase substrate-binding domain-containing protein [Actinomadura parmotrematis]